MCVLKKSHIRILLISSLLSILFSITSFAKLPLEGLYDYQYTQVSNGEIYEKARVWHVIVVDNQNGSYTANEPFSGESIILSNLNNGLYLGYDNYGYIYKLNNNILSIDYGDSTDFLTVTDSLTKGWFNHFNDKYYISDNNKIVTNQWVGNYYLGSNGKMLTNSWTPDGYYVGEDGAWNGQPAITTSNLSSYSAANQQAVMEDIWNGQYGVSNRTDIYYWDSEADGVDYLHADNNSVQIKGFFQTEGDYYGYSQYIGYHDKTFTFSKNCTFWGCGGEGDASPYSRSEFIQILNRHNGLYFCFTVENDVIVRAELWS